MPYPDLHFVNVRRRKEFEFCRTLEITQTIKEHCLDLAFILKFPLMQFIRQVPRKVFIDANAAGVFA